MKQQTAVDMVWYVTIKTYSVGAGMFIVSTLTFLLCGMVFIRILQ